MTKSSWRQFLQLRTCKWFEQNWNSWLLAFEMLINKDLTKSSRRQSLQLEKCTSNLDDPQPMMAIDGRGEVDVSWPRAIIWLHLLWKNWSNTVNQKRNYLRKSPRQFLVYVERRDRLTFFQADSLFLDTTCLKTVLWGNRKYAKGPKWQLKLKYILLATTTFGIWPKKVFFVF